MLLSNDIFASWIMLKLMTQEENNRPAPLPLSCRQTNQINQKAHSRAGDRVNHPGCIENARETERSIQHGGELRPAPWPNELFGRIRLVHFPLHPRGVRLGEPSLRVLRGGGIYGSVRCAGVADPYRK